jgi:S1-C subfamily serine protease
VVAERFPEKQRPIFTKAVGFTVGINLPGYKEAGSGIIISKNGLILTAWHVIKSASNFSVTLYNLPPKSWTPKPKSSYKAKLIAGYPELDVALLSIQKLPKDLPRAVLGDSSQVETGDTLYRIGRDEVPLDTGHLCQMEEEGDLFYFLISLKTSYGASGGAVVDERARVVAFSLYGPPKKNIKEAPYVCALPINIIKKLFLRRFGVRC